MIIDAEVVDGDEVASVAPSASILKQKEGGVENSQIFLKSLSLQQRALHPLSHQKSGIY